MQLENMMEMYQPKVSENKHQTYFVVEDLESLSANALYSGEKPILKDWGIIIPLKINGIPVHDTYKVNKDGKLSNGHSTVNLPKGGMVYMPIEKGKPSIKKGS